jgi:serine/threonine-protein kinase HipA
MRKAEVFYDNILCGNLTETSDGEYIFEYHHKYIPLYPDRFITFTMPVREESYKSKRLFPFFEGLVPEGWMLDITLVNWKLNRSDRMGLLMTVCRDCIGAVSIRPIEAE